MTIAAVLQSSYIPWKGYFDIIHDVDLFVFYDDVQYTSRDWRNRNQIKTRSGSAWLTVPVGNSINRSICEVNIADDKWQKKHFETLRRNYARTAYFDTFENYLRKIYLETRWNNLSELNQNLIKTISRDFLGLKTEFSDSRFFNVAGTKHQRLLNLVKTVGADVYLSGPSAKEYIIEEEFQNAGIRIIWKDYSGYPKYHQLYGEFNHNVSILDLLFSTGENAPYYIWGWR